MVAGEADGVEVLMGLMRVLDTVTDVGLALCPLAGAVLMVGLGVALVSQAIVTLAHLVH